jgi:hypothetical protein
MRFIPSMAFACALAACAQLLPRQTQSVPAFFDSFAAAERSIQQVVPFRTTTAELRTFGFDVHDSANVTLIPYPELVSRLAPNPSVPFHELDPGIRECILARLACEAFEFHIGHEVRQREGGFWADFLNFKRTTDVSGWRFQAIVVVRDRNYGGEPRIARTDVQRNPLGALQPAGEGVSGLLIH